MAVDGDEKEQDEEEVCEEDREQEQEREPDRRVHGRPVLLLLLILLFILFVCRGSREGNSAAHAVFRGGELDGLADDNWPPR
jgi:hypothetical protein